MNLILAVINDWSAAGEILDRSRKVAEATGARVHVYCPVSSEMEELNRYIGFENFDDVRQELVRASEALLEALPGLGDLPCEVEWQSRVYQGVARKAEDLSAGMIVMSRCRHNVLGDLLHKPDDWHLLRDASCPVLVLGEGPQHYRSVVAAVDALEDDGSHAALNGRVLDQAQLLAQALGLPLTVVSVVPEPSYIFSDITAIDSVIISKFRDESQDIAVQRQRAMLARLGITPQGARVVMGRVESALQKQLAESGLLVLGTIANKGLKGFFIGNTCERLLRGLEGDMLVVN